MSSRGSRASPFEVIVEKTLIVDDRGGTREITVQEALQQRTYRDALAGKGMAQREIVKWILKREAWLAKHVPKAPGLAINYSYDSDNADTALLLLGIAAHNPDRAGRRKDRAHLLLEPWAVQTALPRARHRSGLCRSRDRTLVGSDGPRTAA